MSSLFGNPPALNIPRYIGCPTLLQRHTLTTIIVQLRPSTKHNQLKLRAVNILADVIYRDIQRLCNKNGATCKVHWPKKHTANNSTSE